MHSPLVAGDEVRNWNYIVLTGAIWPYNEHSLEAEDSLAVLRLLWRYRTQLSDRVAYGHTQLERDLKWFEYSMFFEKRFRTPLSIVFAFVATHNHFVLDRDGKVFKQSAPVIKLPREASEVDHLGLLGLLNSSIGCFWMKQIFHDKGSTVDAHGARQTTVAFENFREFTATGLLKFPLPADRPLLTARLLDSLATRARFSARRDRLPRSAHPRGLGHRPVRGSMRPVADDRRSRGTRLGVLPALWIDGRGSHAKARRRKGRQALFRPLRLCAFA